MAGGSTIPANKPNGIFTAYFGDGTSCVRHLIDRQDWAEGLKSSDKAKWAMSAQSGTIFDGPGFPGNTIKNVGPNYPNGCYRGYE